MTSHRDSLTWEGGQGKTEEKLKHITTTISWVSHSTPGPAHRSDRSRSSQPDQPTTRIRKPRLGVVKAVTALLGTESKSNWILSDSKAGALPSTQHGRVGRAQRGRGFLFYHVTATQKTEAFIKTGSGARQPGSKSGPPTVTFRTSGSRLPSVFSLVKG